MYLKLTIYVWVSWRRSNKARGGEGSVSEFKGKRIIGVLAGLVETSNEANKGVMKSTLEHNNFLQWFVDASIDIPFQKYSSSDSSTSTAASAARGKPQAVLPRRGYTPQITGLLFRMRKSAMVTCPRLANYRLAGSILKSKALTVHTMAF